MPNITINHDITYSNADSNVFISILNSPRWCGHSNTSNEISFPKDGLEVPNENTS